MLYYFTKILWPNWCLGRGPIADTLAVIVSLIAIIIEMRSLKTPDKLNTEGEIAIA